MAICLLVSVPAAGDVAFADQTSGEEHVVLENNDGQQVVINVEEELSAEDAAQQAQSANGVATISDEETPLAGYSKVKSNKGDQNIHIIWMVLLLIAAIAYAVYFMRYQNRIFTLRRQIAEAEYRMRKGGK